MFKFNKVQISTIIFYLIVFGLFILLGYSFDASMDEDFGNRDKVTFISIFTNNFKYVLLNIFLGTITCCIYNIYSLFLNGVVLGNVIKTLVYNGMSESIFTGIIPHGIFEIPGIILSVTIPLVFYIGLFKTFRKKEGKVAFIKRYLKENIINILCLDFLLILLAAIIESTISFA